MEEDFEDISEDILAKEKKATEGLLPTKSRAVYDNEYKLFVGWKLKYALKIVNETVMMAYFQELVCFGVIVTYINIGEFVNFVPPLQSEKYAPNSLWKKYSILKSTLIVNDNVDISRFNRLLAFLKQRSKGYIPKKSKDLTAEQENLRIVIFISERTLPINVSCFVVIVW